jgi:adenylate cyclase
MRLNPLPTPGFYLDFGNALKMLERFEEAVSFYKKAIQLSPNNFLAHLHLAISYSLMGRERDARAEADEVLRINPKFSVDEYAKGTLWKDQSITDKYAKALRKAGLK